MKIVDPTDPPDGFEAEAPVRTAQVIRWEGITRHDIPVERVLEGAQAEGMKVVVVLGYGSDGAEYFAASVADGADVLWLLERCKLRLLTGSTDTNPV